MWLYHFYHFSPKKNILTSKPPTSFFLTILAPNTNLIHLLLGAKRVRKKDVEGQRVRKKDVRGSDVKKFLFGLKW
ncbi:hypothetical protein HanRHA438_Chr15g0685141 [Helianthus annuus]|nr:hypothetical protein HanIR_Chr15g0731011 [Helianthus annuus]KAJ0842865.1 hypothetical protein HanRHA438_Chr15g0685141 [Helianthus annuus]